MGVFHFLLQESRQEEKVLDTSLIVSDPLEYLTSFSTFSHSPTKMTTKLEFRKFELYIDKVFHL